MKNILVFTLLVFFVSIVKILAQDGDFNALETADTIKIDGIADDSVWIKQEWNDINYVWIPYNGNISSSDFTGKFKVAWDSAMVYLLVEVVDDSLYDGHVNPTDNYWNDDCVEVFLDEDHSGGIHENNFNAFAYHVGINYDVVDNGLTGATTFNSHINTMRVRNGSTYTWELAIKIYDDSYQAGSTNIPVKLEANKVLGFSLAYCDNDGSVERENFIGSKYLTAANANRSYIDASIFGTLTLKKAVQPSDPDIPDVINKIAVVTKDIGNYSIYPTICSNNLVLKNEGNNQSTSLKISISDLKGTTYYTNSMILKQEEVTMINTQYLPSGIYTIHICSRNETINARFIKVN